MSAGMMARVSGMRMRSVVPTPTRESISTLPPIFSTLVRTTSMPTPRPLTLVTARRWRSRGERRVAAVRARPSSAARSGGDEPALDGLLAHFFDGDAGAVVGNLDDDVAAFLDGAQFQRAFGVLACGLAHIGRLDAVIERVAHGVGERVLDGLKQALVELGLLALHLQIHAPAERLREVADDARHLGEDIRDRLHARLHHRLAQIGGDHIQAARKQGHIRVGGGGLQNLVAGEHQFAHQVHHAVEQGHVDAQACFPRRFQPPGCGLCGVGGSAAGSCGDGRGFDGAARRAQAYEGAARQLRGGGWLMRRGNGELCAAGSQPEFLARRRAAALARTGLRLRAGACNSSSRSMSAASSPAPSLPSGSMVLRMARSPSSNCKSAVMTAASARQFVVAQQAEQVFAGVCQFLQALEAEKARGSLNGVHGAKDFAQQGSILRPLLELGQAPLHAVQAFLALDQELPRQFVHGSHSSGRPRSRPRAAALKSFIGKMARNLRRQGTREQGAARSLKICHAAPLLSRGL